MGNLIDCWQGVLSHAILLLIQPSFYAIRFYFTPGYLDSASRVWLAINTMIWLYVLTRLTIPFITSPLRHLPSPPPGPFPIAHFKAEPPRDIFLEMFKNTPNDGIIALWMPFYLSAVLLPTTPAGLLDMLNTHNYDWEKPRSSRKFLRRTLGEGLINVEGNQHKAMRRNVAPAFSGRHIRDLTSLFYGKGIAFADSLSRQLKSSADKTLETTEHLSRVTLDIIGAACVGKDFDTINNDADPLAKLYADITSTDRGNIFIFFTILSFFPIWLLKCMRGTRYARITNAQIQLRKEVGYLMQEKRQKLREKSEQQKDIISIILRSGEFSDDYLIDQLLTFLAAGHETTSNSLTWTLMFLSKYPAMQDRLRAECNRHLSSYTAETIDASLFDTTTTPYLTAVCNETLRFYPTVPGTERYCVKPTRIANHHIPAGTTAVLSMWAINRNPAFWGPDAESYNPDRWLKGDPHGGATSPHALLTFLHGPRSCIGQSFALLEMKCLLAVLVMRFRFELVDPEAEVAISGFLTIKPTHGLRLKLHDLKAESGEGK